MDDRVPCKIFQGISRELRRHREDPPAISVFYGDRDPRAAD